MPVKHQRAIRQLRHHLVHGGDSINRMVGIGHAANQVVKFGLTKANASLHLLTLAQALIHSLTRLFSLLILIVAKRLKILCITYG